MRVVNIRGLTGRTANLPSRTRPVFIIPTNIQTAMSRLAEEPRQRLGIPRLMGSRLGNVNGYGSPNGNGGSVGSTGSGGSVVSPTLPFWTVGAVGLDGIGGTPGLFGDANGFQGQVGVNGSQGANLFNAGFQGKVRGGMNGLLQGQSPGEQMIQGGGAGMNGMGQGVGIPLTSVRPREDQITQQNKSELCCDPVSTLIGSDPSRFSGMFSAERGGGSQGATAQSVHADKASLNEAPELMSLHASVLMVVRRRRRESGGLCMGCSDDGREESETASPDTDSGLGRRRGTRRGVAGRDEEPGEI
ncbi:hypothetical protein B0H14DRAFT_2581178 [Mycena olivaceomarginata]|nr:hypothetical protein B0H14DRAFT_2581178 [Mycena olivaceomarginata]